MCLDAGVRPGAVRIALPHVVVGEQRLLLLDGERLGGIVVQCEGQVVLGIRDEQPPVDESGLGQRHQAVVAAEDPEVPGVPGLPTATVSPRLRRYRPPDERH
jgi:hypothetical protein